MNWWNHPFDTFDTSSNLLSQIRAGGGCIRVGRTVWNTLKGGGTEKRGGETKILKGGGGKSGQEVGALKGGTPYELWYLIKVNWLWAAER